MSGRARPWDAPRIPVLLALFSGSALVEAVRCSSLSSLLNADMWWHLSSGLWILHQYAFPHTGLFSQSSDTPWVATSWTYDLNLAIFYQVMGLRAIPVFTMSFRAGLAVVTFLIAGGRRRNFWTAVALSLVAQYILAAAQPTPAYGSILLFGVELQLLLESRRVANLTPLFWLPPIFLFWANVDVHFVYGLALFALFLASLALENVLPAGETHSLAQAKVATIVAFSLLATILTPYFYHPYGVFFSTTFSAANAYLPDHKAPGFRQPQDYILLLLAMSAFLALGLRRSRDLFLIALLAICAGLSFYAQRDVWLVVLAALAVIGEMLPTRAAAAPDKTRRAEGMPMRDLLISGSLAFVLFAVGAAVLLPRGSEALLAKAGESYPVAAGNFIREQQLPPPLFNAFEWGGFLTWYLPEYPVAIDSRADLYGDDFVIQYSKVMNAKVRYTDFPALANARTIVLPRTAIMAEALKTVPGYKVAYRDSVALVLEKE